jgi:RHS repeat-associated protein
LTLLVHWTDESDLQRYDITRDSRGNPTRVDTTTGAVTTSALYTYDVVSRLKSECYPATGEVCTAKSPRTSYTYDKVGNRTAESARTVEGTTATTVTTDYAYDAADELLTESVGGVATVTNTWSANGALATSTTPTGTQTYVTDLTDELISVTLEDDSLVGYTQDAQGNRTSRTVDGVVDATWAWDDLSSLPTRIGEYDADGTLTTSWLADPTSSTGASLAQTSYGVSSWLLSDPFANTVATVSTTGNTVSGTRSMDAFGVERSPATGALADAAVGFAGQYLDEATGLYDMRARDYDPTSGRFTATDPVQVPTGMPYVAGYSYAFNNPLMYTDATGLSAIGQSDGADGGSSRSGGSSTSRQVSTETSDDSACSQDPGRLPYTHAGYNYGPEDFVSDAAYGLPLLLDLQKQPSSWSHWNDKTTEGLEYRMLLNGYNGGGHTYVGGPICGLYAVCVTGVSWINDHTAMTFGRVILADTDTIFGRDYAWAWSTAWTHRGGDHPDDGNWLEKSANERADAAEAAWKAASGSSSDQAGPRLLPGAVTDVFRTSSYS